jgi:hypothetical protein
MLLICSIIFIELLKKKGHSSKYKQRKTIRINHKKNAKSNLFQVNNLNKLQIFRRKAYRRRLKAGQNVTTYR